MYYSSTKMPSKPIGPSKGIKGVKGSSTSPSSSGSNDQSRTTALDWFTAIADAAGQFAPGGSGTFQPSGQDSPPGETTPVESGRSWVGPVVGVVAGVAAITGVVLFVRSR